MDSTAILTATERPVGDVPPSKEATGKPRKIFISYSRKDQKFALRLADDLRAEGMTIWIDTGIQGGDTWLKKLDEGLEASEEVFLVASPRAKASVWVPKEVLAALNRDMPVRPVKIRSYGTWTLIGDLQCIDSRGRYAEALAELTRDTPPHRTLWRKVLILLNKSWDFRPYFAVLALSIAIAASVYVLSPSNTSLSIAGGDASGIVVRVRNRGGRPSLLVGSSFKLDFGSLPIETEPLILLRPEKALRIPGHGNLELSLKDDELLRPKVRNAKSYYSVDDVLPHLAGAKITLRAQVKESDDRVRTLTEVFPGERIREFVLEAFPYVRQPKYR